MKNAEIIIITLFVLAAAFFAFLYWCELELKRKYRALLAEAEHKASMYGAAFHDSQEKMFVVAESPTESVALIRVMAQCSTLEIENGLLRADVAEGCKIINDQKAVINNLRRCLSDCEARNKRPKHR